MPNVTRQILRPLTAVLGFRCNRGPRQGVRFSFRRSESMWVKTNATALKRGLGIPIGIWRAMRAWRSWGPLTLERSALGHSGLMAFDGGGSANLTVDFGDRHQKKDGARSTSTSPHNSSVFPLPTRIITYTVANPYCYCSRISLLSIPALSPAAIVCIQTGRFPHRHPCWLVLINCRYNTTERPDPLLKSRLPLFLLIRITCIDDGCPCRFYPAVFLHSIRSGAGTEVI